MMPPQEPNYTQIPNVFLDNLHMFDEIEVKVMTQFYYATYRFGGADFGGYTAGELAKKVGEDLDLVAPACARLLERRWIETVFKRDDLFVLRLD